MQLDENEIRYLREASPDEALESLYEKYSGVIYGLSCRMLGDSLDAQDVTQEVFVKIWRHWSRYDWNKGPLFNWIIVITKRTIYDKLRARKTRHDHLKSSQLANRLENSSSLHLEAIDLSDKVESLDDNLAELIDLLYFSGHTQVEASKILDIPLGTVKSRARKALHRLRDIYIKSDLKTLLPILGLLISSVWIV